MTDNAKTARVEDAGFSGIGLSTTPQEAAMLARWRLEQRRATWNRLSYLSIGVSSRDQVTEELPSLLRSAGLTPTVHLLELNFMQPLKSQEGRVRSLIERIELIQPSCVEEDMGLWCWGETELEQHMLQAFFDEDSAATIARNAAELQRSLGIPLYLENPPVYFELGTIDLLSFMQRVAEDASCGLVLDIGHLVGYCVATARDPQDYLAAWSGIEHVRELHVAGYALRPDQVAPMWYDDHATPLSEYSLSLLELAQIQAGRRLPITLEQEGASYARIAAHIDRVSERFDA